MCFISVVAIYLCVCGTKEQKDKLHLLLQHMSGNRMHRTYLEHEIRKIKSSGPGVEVVVSQKLKVELWVDYLTPWESLIAQKVQAMLSEMSELILRYDECRYCPVKLCSQE